MIAIIVLSAFLLGAVFCDLKKNKLPNYYLLLGFALALAIQALEGWGGVVAGVYGLLVGFAIFIPFYALGGMAAGDVKLMAVVGCFLGVPGILWASAYSLMAGGVMGVAYLLHKGHLGRLLERYWAMASLHARIPAADDDAARHRFPYAVAIAVGTFLSLFWVPV